MRLSVKTLAAMLTGLALAAFNPVSDAQSRRDSRSPSSSYSRSSSNKKNAETRPQASRPSRPDVSPAQRHPAQKPSVQRPPVQKPPVQKPPVQRPPVRPNKPAPGFKPGNQHKPMPVYRPVRPRRPRVPYRPIVVRPSYGTVIAADIAARMAWTAVNIAYFNTVARTYDQIGDNARTIADQNAIIAQNNATIASQNQTIASQSALLASNQLLSQQAYTLANELGLIQSFAAADASYFYQDGVFYTQGPDGQYRVIVPPAGALVEALPDDYETVRLKGNDYYKVDNTIYKVNVVDGKPYFEVLGQMN